MRIVIAAVSSPLAMNGVSRHAANLASALAQCNSISEVHFIAGSWQKEMFQHCFDHDNPRFHVHSISLGDTRISRLAWYYRELPHIAAQLDADVVHFACPAPLRAGAFRCSTVVSLHDLYPFDIPENFGLMKSSLTRLIMAQCLRNVGAIACVSESTRSRLESLFPQQAAKATTICNVVEPDRSPRVESFSRVPEGRPFLLCVAQHRRNKNVLLAIRIFHSLIEQRIMPCSSQLLVVGIPGPETRRIVELVQRLKLEHNVSLLSGLTDGELQWCYRHCKLLLAPSSTEGFGLPIAEALLAGCPVVCSDIPAFREIGNQLCHFVKSGGDLVPRYAEAIRKLLCVRRPAAVFLPQLSRRVIGQQYAELYERLAFCGVSSFWYATATRT